MKGKHWLVIEFVLLFFGVPTLIYLDRDFIRPSIIILPALVFIFILLRRNSDFHWRELFRWRVPRKTMYANVVIIMILYPADAGICLFFPPREPV